MQLQTLVDTNGPTASVESISRSVGRKVYFLGLSVGDFEALDDDSMISVADL